MERTISTNGIGEKIVTLYVDSATKTKLDALTNGIPDEGLAVTLTGDNTVGFGTTADGAAADVLFGLIKTYSGGETVGVQYVGFATEVKAKKPIAKGATILTVTSAGEISTVSTGGTATNSIVIKAAVSSELTVDILIR